MDPRPPGASPMSRQSPSYCHAMPILSVDLIEDRFRFTSTITAGSAALDRLERARI